MKKEKDILIRVSSELKEKVIVLAKAEGLSVSAFIRQLLTKLIK